MRVAQGALGDLGEAVIELVVFPVVGREAARLPEFLEPLFLRCLRQVQPQLHNQGAVCGEHVFKGFDPVERTVELAALGLAIDPVDDRCRVPGAEQDPDPAVTGQGAPESPEFRPLQFLITGTPEGVGGHAPRVEPFVQPVHQLAFAGSIRPGDDHDHGEFPAAQIQVGLQQPGAQLRQRGIIGFLRQGVAQFGGG